MNLTRHSDLALRVLLFVGLRGDRLSSVREISEAYRVSKNHLVKVAHRLMQLGLVETVRGRQGGLKLARPPGEITVGEVIRGTEPGFDLVECFDPATDTCPITPACRLQSVLRGAKDRFLEELDRHTLEDLLRNRRRLSALVEQGPADRRT